MVPWRLESIFSVILCLHLSQNVALSQNLSSLASASLTTAPNDPGVILTASENSPSLVSLSETYLTSSPVNNPSVTDIINSDSSSTFWSQVTIMSTTITPSRPTEVSLSLSTSSAAASVSVGNTETDEPLTSFTFVTQHQGDTNILLASESSGYLGISPSHETNTFVLDKTSSMIAMSSARDQITTVSSYGPEATQAPSSPTSTASGSSMQKFESSSTHGVTLQYSTEVDTQSTSSLVTETTVHGALLSSDQETMSLTTSIEVHVYTTISTNSENDKGNPVSIISSSEQEFSPVHSTTTYLSITSKPELLTINPMLINSSTIGQLDSESNQESSVQATEKVDVTQSWATSSSNTVYYSMLGSSDILTTERFSGQVLTTSLSSKSLTSNILSVGESLSYSSELLTSQQENIPLTRVTEISTPPSVSSSLIVKSFGSTESSVNTDSQTQASSMSTDLIKPSLSTDFQGSDESSETKAQTLKTTSAYVDILGTSSMSTHSLEAKSSLTDNLFMTSLLTQSSLPGARDVVMTLSSEFPVSSYSHAHTESLTSVFNTYSSSEHLGNTVGLSSVPMSDTNNSSSIGYPHDVITSSVSLTDTIIPTYLSKFPILTSESSDFQTKTTDLFSPTLNITQYETFSDTLPNHTSSTPLESQSMTQSTTEFLTSRDFTSGSDFILGSNSVSSIMPTEEFLFFSTKYPFLSSNAETKPFTSDTKTLTMFTNSSIQIHVIDSSASVIESSLVSISSHQVSTSIFPTPTTSASSNIMPSQNVSSMFQSTIIISPSSSYISQSTFDDLSLMFMSNLTIVSASPHQISSSPTVTIGQPQVDASPPSGLSSYWSAVNTMTSGHGSLFTTMPTVFFSSSGAMTSENTLNITDTTSPGFSSLYITSTESSELSMFLRSDSANESKSFLPISDFSSYSAMTTIGLENQSSTQLLLTSSPISEISFSEIITLTPNYNLSLSENSVITASLSTNKLVTMTIIPHESNSTLNLELSPSQVELDTTGIFLTVNSSEETSSQSLPSYPASALTVDLLSQTQALSGTTGMILTVSPSEETTSSQFSPNFPSSTSMGTTFPTTGTTTQLFESYWTWILPSHSGAETLETGSVFYSWTSGLYTPMTGEDFASYSVTVDSLSSSLLLASESSMVFNITADVLSNATTNPTISTLFTTTMTSVFDNVTFTEIHSTALTNTTNILNESSSVMPSVETPSSVGNETRSTTQSVMTSLNTSLLVTDDSLSIHASTDWTTSLPASFTTVLTSNMTEKLLESTTLSSSVSWMTSASLLNSVTVSTPMLNFTTSTLNPSINTTEYRTITPTPAVQDVSENVNMSTSLFYPTSVSVNLTDLTTFSTLQNQSVSFAPNVTMNATTTTAMTTTTTRTTTTTTILTTTLDPVKNFYMKTSIKVSPTQNTSDPVFANRMENRLAEVYLLAFETQGQGTSGNSQGKRRRKKRYAKIGNIGIDMKEMTRGSGAEANVLMMVYTVDQNGNLVPVTTAASAMNSLTDQEVAIRMLHVVVDKGSPFISLPSLKDVTQAPATSSSNLWIVGVVVGGIVVLIVLIVAIVCFAKKAARRPDGTGDQAKLASFTPVDKQKKKYKGDVENPSNQGSLTSLHVQSPKKQLYDVSSAHTVGSHEMSSNELKKQRRTESGNKSNKSSRYEETSETASLVSEDRKKPPVRPNSKGSRGSHNKRESKNKDKHADKAKEEDKKTSSSSEQADKSNFPSCSLEDIEALYKNRELEKKTNKTRIKEKKKKELEVTFKDSDADKLMQEYLAAQEEIDKVLDAPPQNGPKPLPDVFIDKQEERPTSSAGQVNGGFAGDESLQEARSRMHQLLDDAFALISPSSSSLANNQVDEGFHSPRNLSPRASFINQRSTLMLVEPGPSSSPTPRDIFMVASSAPTPIPNENVYMPDSLSEDDLTAGDLVIVDLTAKNEGSPELHKEKKHEPMYYNPAFGKFDDLLPTWSPYRAADQVALISMPNTLQTDIGRSGSAKKSGGKRPAAILSDANKNKGMDKRRQQNGGAPKPLVLKTRELLASKELEQDKIDPKITKPMNLADIAGKNRSKQATSAGQGFDGNADNGENIAMESLKLNLRKKNSKKHKAPSEDLPNGKDETDIVSESVIAGKTPEATIESIRKELASISARYSNKDFNAKHSHNGSGLLTDIA